ncbi:MAG: hypothetical protein ABID54_01305, partial [Pseudomonadota bacterium]
MIVRENFPNDRDYTYDRLIEESAKLELRLRDGTWKLKECDGLQVVCDEIYTELGLMQLHLSDGSWHLCSCNPEKHLPLISGLASEGFGFTDDPTEKDFMRKIRDEARIWRAKIIRGKFAIKEADELRAWARDLRHRIELKDWSATKNIEEQIKYAESPLAFVEVVEQINALTGNLQEIEDRHVDEVLTKLAENHGVEKPRYRFIDKCDPLREAYQIGYDRLELVKTGDDKMEIKRTPLTEHDELIFC